MRLLPLSLILSLILCAPLSAQVPSLLNYQGRVAVSGVNFDGTGQFKFALVNADGTQTFWSNDGTSTAGSEPTSAVAIAVDSGIYSVLLGDATLPNMTPVPAALFSNPDVRIRTWFDDGVNGSQLMAPDQRVAAVGYAMVSSTVSDGAITSDKIAAGAVGTSQLAAGAVTGSLGSEGLSAVPSGGIIGSSDPADAALLAQGYVRDPISLTAGEGWAELPGGDAVAGHTTVWTGSELLIWGGVIGSGDSGGGSSFEAINRGLRYIPSTGTWSPISLVGAPQARFGHSAVWTGTELIIWGGQSTGVGGSFSEVLNTGGRYNPATDTWSAMAPNLDGGMEDKRTGHNAVWTGSKMLVFGGSTSEQNFGEDMPGGGILLQGRIYDPVANTWSSMASHPTELEMGSELAAVWTGTEAIVWRGQDSSPSIDPPFAGRYNPATDTWSTLPRIPGSSPVAETGFTAVWSGTEMILFGGFSMSATDAIDEAYLFNPTTDTWTTATTTGAPAGRTNHLAAWTGSEMIVWGGGEGTDPSDILFLEDGARYNPVTDSWQALPTTGVPSGRKFATGTWAGDRFAVWAGGQFTSPIGSSSKMLKQGSTFDPVAGTWSPLAFGSPAPRAGHSAVWTGSEWIIWGGTTGTDGYSFDPTLNDGARFNPTTGVWTPLSMTDAPSGRWNHTAVWTGTEMIIWGGQEVDSGGGGGSQTLSDGARYNPTTDTWTPVTPTGAPSQRTQHRSVWTGSVMLVWGGDSDGSGFPLNDGARYNPITNSWTPISSTGAPSARRNHVCVWTGTEMLVWGNGFEVDGGRYNPITDTWQGISSPGQSGPGTQPSSGGLLGFWTGTDMLVFDAASGSPLLASYSPISDVWQPLSTSGVPSNLNSVSGTWTGTEMILWGTDNNFPAGSVGTRFNLATGTWTGLTDAGAPSSGFGSLQWTGTELLLWGGPPLGESSPSIDVSDAGARYQLPRSIHLYRRP